MVMYKIESVKKKRNKKLIILIIIISIILITMAIFGGIKLAEYVMENRNIPEDQNDKEIPLNIIDDGKQNKEEIYNKNNSKLTKEQLKSIDDIYDIKEKVAFLTFDDGPSNAITPKILDVLKKEDIKATFFVLGTMVRSNPEILKREQEEGHYIANHGYSHVYSKIYSSDKKPLEEYNKTNKEIQKVLENNNYQSNVFRFPGGAEGGYYANIKNKAKKKFKENGIAYLDWNCLTNDSDGAKTKKEIISNLKTTCKGKNSIVVLMHDAPNKDLTANTLPDVISYLRKQGYSFKNLYDVL